MDTNFDEAFAKVVGVEGHYSNDPADSGGETMFGVTVEFVLTQAASLNCSLYVSRLLRCSSISKPLAASVTGS